MGPIEYLAVFFGGYFTKDDLFTKPILINPPSSKFTEPRSSGVQTFVDDFLGVMFDEFVPLLADMDHDAMAVGFVDEHGGMLPLSIQSQMILAYKYHAKRRYLEGISKEQVLGLLHGKSRKEVLEELMKVLEEFFSKKSLLLDTWTRSTAALFARILLLRKYSSLVKSQTEFKEKYTALSMWIDGVESSLHGDVFPFPNTLTKIDMDIHLHALRPLLTFAKAYFVPFLLLDGERYKYLIDGYDAYAQQLCT